MLKQPVGFVKLTNVALVKFGRKNQRVEIACYKNKVIDWRNGNEENIDSVLQSDEIFSNAIQGEIAAKTLLKKIFGEDVTRKQILRIILDKGDLQISQKERAVLSENVLNEVVKILALKLVHPKTLRVYSEMAVKNALKTIGFKPAIDMNAKKQAFKIIKRLEKRFFVMRIPYLVEVASSELAFLTEEGVEFQDESKGALQKYGPYDKSQSSFPSSYSFYLIFELYKHPILLLEFNNC